MKTLRVGLIGYGFIGKVHAYGHLTMPFFYDTPGFRSVITHVCTAHAETAERAKAATGAANAVADFREITENPEIDVVDIATPNDKHYEALVSAIQHGKHIYCDKPLTSDVADARALRGLLKNYTGVAQMTLQNRFFPSTIRAKQLMESGMIGEILEFRANFLHSGNASPETPLKWKLCAGTIADLGSHLMDLMDWLTGGFAEVSAFSRIAWPERPAFGHPETKVKVPAEDAFYAAVRLPNGAMGQISASKIATGTEDELSFEIHGSKGAVKLLPMDYDKLWYYDLSKPDSPYGGTRGWTVIDCGQRYEKPAGFPTPKAPIGWLRGHAHCLYNFLNAAAQGKACEPSLERGIRIQEMMETVRQSALQNGKVLPF